MLACAMITDGRKYRPRRPEEENKQPKSQPSPFSAVIGRPGSDEPGRLITALNRVS